MCNVEWLHTSHPRRAVPTQRCQPFPTVAWACAGREFTELPRAQQIQVLGGKGGRVFSRAEPKHKQDIVRLLKVGRGNLAFAFCLTASRRGRWA